MSEIRLYCPTLTEGSLTLSTRESRHADVAKRLRPGDEIVLFDGAGREAVGTVIEADRCRMQVEVSRITHRPFESRYRITLAVAVPKAHRQGYLVEKCTELGVAVFQPIVAEHSVVKPGDTLVDRWTRRAVEAAKQSGRAWVPSVMPPQPFSTVVEKNADFAATALTDVQGDGPSFASFLKGHVVGTSIMVLVGPEGGWSDTERDQAAKAGAVTVKLSPMVLRTETAAATVCAAVALASD